MKRLIVVAAILAHVNANAMSIEQLKQSFPSRKTLACASLVAAGTTIAYLTNDPQEASAQSIDNCLETLRRSNEYLIDRSMGSVIVCMLIGTGKYITVWATNKVGLGLAALGGYGLRKNAYSLTINSAQNLKKLIC